MSILTEYREDEEPDRGFCPVCGEPLAGLTLAGRGFCEQHGWQFAEWNSAIDEEEEEREDD